MAGLWGKEITCLDDGSILVNQPIYTQEKVAPIPIARERARQKMSKCTEKEITQLRGLLGELGLVKQGNKGLMLQAGSHYYNKNYLNHLYRQSWMAMP